MEEVIFTDSQGNKLLGTISIPNEAKSVVIMSHGFTSSKESKLYVELQNELNKLGIGSLRYDYYGHWRLYCKNTKYTVTKDFTLSKWVDSLKSAISLVRSIGNFDISLMGSSFWWLISLVTTSKESNIKSLVLKSAVTEPIKFWQWRVGAKGIAEWKEKWMIHYNDCGENFELDYTFWEDLLSFDTYKLS